MLNASAQFDTVVVDDPDEQPRPSLGRVPTEELTVQIYAMCWHRRTPDALTTACGIPTNHAYMPTRREELSGDLCPDCFTAYERDRAELENKKRRQRGEHHR
jgi:hypothetical protein